MNYLKKISSTVLIISTITLALQYQSYAQNTYEYDCKKDSYIHLGDDDPFNDKPKNFGSSTELKSYWVYNSKEYRYVVCMQFLDNVSFFMKVKKATLQLSEKIDQYGSDLPSTVSLYQITSEWDENTITGNNYPSLRYVGNYQIDASGLLDLTDFYNDLAINGAIEHHGIAFRPSSDGADVETLLFNSNEVFPMKVVIEAEIGIPTAILDECQSNIQCNICLLYTSPSPRDA